MPGFASGAICGVLVQLYSNSVRKLPMMRRKCAFCNFKQIHAVFLFRENEQFSTFFFLYFRVLQFHLSSLTCVLFLSSTTDPWEHVLFGVVGGTLGYKFNQYDQRNKADLLVLMESMDKFGTARPLPSDDAHADEEE